MLVVSSLVITVQQVLKALYPDIASALGPYVGLIVTNCIVMGRLESFSSRNNVTNSFFDALGMSCGYALGLFFMGGFRELFGTGNLLGLRIMPDWYPACRFLVTAPGAFLVFAALIFMGNYLAWQQKRGS
jgi:Na+-transporting NADH:ubiquinone oxidoreductase subunit D